MHGLLVLILVSFSAAAQSPVARAISYLAAESANWRPDNGCFSCHNNGDAARVLFLSKSAPPSSLSATQNWLADPDKWDANGEANPAASDKKLARIQFSAALLASPIATPKILFAAAKLLIAQQDPAGPWRIEPEAAPGSPITYGTALATWQALQVLQSVNTPQLANPIANARRWLHTQTPSNLLENSSLILAGHPQAALYAERLLTTQTSSGGWGPQPNAPAEVFDTALALLALHSLPPTPAITKSIAKARQYLLETQLPEGGWLETTRPSGGRSYAHHISTSAWALQALLADTNR